MASSDKPTAIQTKQEPSTRHISTRMVQNVLLVWLDAYIDENDTDCQNSITHLRRVMSTINTFTDGDQCIEFVEELQNEKVCMVVSGSFGQQIVPRVHDMAQVHSIFIFCGNKEYHEEWTNAWSKVKGIYTDITLICDVLKQSAKDCEQNTIGFSLVASGGDLSNINLDRLDPMFMYTQITKEILLVIEFEQKHILDFTKYCRDVFEGNKHELSNVDKLEQDYHNKTPIYWYTWESFLYSMLNRALRVSDMDVIVKMGFFIGDLHRQIDELHKQQYGDSNVDQQFTVYRGQGMGREEFQEVLKSKGGLIAFNNFLSTSRIETVSIVFARGALRNPDLVGVLFEMNIHLEQSTAPFASVAKLSAYGNKEGEILFAMHTVFRIREVQQVDGNARLFRVKLELTSDNDRDLQVLTQRIREDTFPDAKGWDRLGLVLLKLGKSKQAEEIYQIVLEQQSDESRMGYLYNQLGLCKDQQADYDEAIRLYEKSIAIDEKYFPDSPDVAASYNNIGLVYQNMGEYTKALSSYEKSLAIKQQSLPPDHPDLAASYGNIGLVYYNMGENAKALSYYEKDLEITEQSLPSNHPDLAPSYGNIGLVYHRMGENTKALWYHQKDLAIKQQSLPPNHPDLATSYNNVGAVYEGMKNSSKAYSFYEKAVKIGEQSLSPNHPELLKWRHNFDRMKNKRV